MKTAPLLLGVALLFWGWQTGFFLVGLLLAVAVESARFVKARWEFSDQDFSRTWSFCTLLFLAAAVYAFTANEGPASFGGFFQRPNLFTERNAGTASARTAASLIRWLPMIFFPLLAAQAFSARGAVPLTSISLIARRRQRKARMLGQALPPDRTVNVTYVYFAFCLIAASTHPPENNTYFWGLCALLAWALWSQRSIRFSLPVWAGALAVAIVLGYVGQFGVSQLQRSLENLNASWFARFGRRSNDPAQTRTALGQIGGLKTSPKIVIRLEPKIGNAPPLLREATYRTYKFPVWHSGTAKEEFENIGPETNSTTYVLLRGKSTAASVGIACYLSERARQSGNPAGLLPLPAGSGRLENLSAYLLQKNGLGAVLAEGPGLVMFDAPFGPGATLDSAPTDEDRTVPPREAPALDQIISDLNVGSTNTDQMLRAIGRFFESKFSYSTWQSRHRALGTNETELSRFLLSTRSGHCEYFATATVLLLRRLDIPARYAVGYAVHERSGPNYVVRLRDAHSWCLVWNREKQHWEDFDTTPASWFDVEAKRASAGQFLSDVLSWLGFQISKVRWGQSHLREYTLWTLVPVLALLLYQIIFRRGRRRHSKGGKGAEQPSTWPGLDSEFYLLEEKLAQRSVPRGGSEPLDEWLRRVAQTRELAELRAPLQELLRLHYRYRFDPLGLNEADRTALKRETRMCLESLSRAEAAASDSGK
jgi:hypothetical protein